MKKHSMKEWLIATRPWSFPASTIPVAVTLAYLHWAGHEVNWLTGLWALVNIVLFHAAGNTWSDYFDYKCGVDTPENYSVKTLTGGQFEPKEIYRLALGLLTVALIGGIGLMCLTGWQLLWYGIGGALCTLLYPYLKYRALGDVVIGIAYAWLPMWGTSFVAIGHVDMRVLLLAIPVGMITIAILHVNNTRDIRTDGEAHITTLAMKIGHRRSSVLYCFWVLFPFFSVAACIAAGLFPWWTLLTFLALPIALGNARRMKGSTAGTPSVIASLDQGTAQLQLVFGLLFCLSFFIARGI